jgi:crossover junction endodeoxyribonuclease RuvC
MDKPRIVIGIDPGKSGGAVALDMYGRPIEWVAANHPEEGYTIKATGGAHYIPTEMALWLVGLMDSYRIVLVITEKQQARPLEGRTSILTTGYGWGLWVGILAALGLPYKVEPPGVWTRGVFGSMPKGTDRKARAVTTARSRVPDLPLTWGRKKKPHDGLADACCMALRALAEFPRK